MSEVKIYDGVTINMSTSEVISHGEITYVDNNKVSRLGGGGDKQQTTTSGVADKAYEQYVSPFLKQAQEAQQSGDLSKVAGFNADQLAAQEAGRKAAGAQTGLEQLMAQQASAEACRGSRCLVRRGEDARDFHPQAFAHALRGVVRRLGRDGAEGARRAGDVRALSAVGSAAGHSLESVSAAAGAGAQGGVYPHAFAALAAEVARLGHRDGQLGRVADGCQVAACRAAGAECRSSGLAVGLS